MNAHRSLLLLAALGSLAAAAGCRIESHKHGDNDNVKIATPFGGMQVRTDNMDVLSAIGLPQYPGATFVNHDKNNGAADIDMSFGSFQLRVKAVNYLTGDPPEKVEAFYRNALGRFGTVIQCSDNRPVGTPARTAEGLTCDKERGNHLQVNEDMGKNLELKAGSQQHQHIVAIERDGNGTKFGLVALDLPAHFGTGDRDSNSRDSNSRDSNGKESSQ